MLGCQGRRSAMIEDVSMADQSSPNESRTDASRPDESRLAASAGIPLPKSRPAEANLEPRAGAPVPAFAQADSAAPSDRRTLLQKLSDLIPGRVRLASLTPEGGLFRSGPDLGALGYDGQTAVYDISAH